ncbi:thiamine pyrophosphate-binding protein [Paenibacillus filicis]|uniref:Thiamine pyrophosphate-binding protein n=1 Tax=Paenibacillus filicis TaxID=669464 RepID=A0ABU9DGQ2_9BACL
METVVQSLVRHFREWGVRHVFSIPGKAIVPLMLEVGNQGVQYVLSRHECGAGYSAAGYALLSQGLGVAIGTSGPGGTNMLTAAGQAKAYHLPVLFITGHASMKDNGKPLGQDSTFFATDLVRMFEPVTLFSARVERGDQFPVYLQHAVEQAVQGVRGPVHLSIPQDVLTEATPSFQLELPSDKPLMMSTRLREALDLLATARRPLLFLGKGVHISRAYDAVQRLAETWGIPVITTPGGKGAFRSTHPLHIGPLGLGGITEAKDYLESGIDVLVVIGTKLSDMSIPFMNDRMVPKHILQFDVDGTFIGKTFPSPTLFVQGDARLNLEALLAEAERLIPAQESAYSLAAAALEAPAPESDTSTTPKVSVGLLTAEQVMQSLGDLLPQDAVVFGDDGSHSYHAIRHLQIGQAGFFRFDDVFAAMGHAIGYSVGAQLAAPDRRIVCLTGDGCMFMHGSEVSTAVNNGAHVLFIVLNNGKLDMVNKGMQNATGRTDGTVYEVPLDAAMYARSMGARVYSADNQLQFEAVLKEALLLKETIVIEACVDPDEIPPTLARG